MGKKYIHITLLLMAAGFAITQLSCKKGDEKMTEAIRSLNIRQKSIISIAAFTATGNQEKLETALKNGLDNGLTINEIKEVLVQMYAYAGFPRSLNGIGTFMKVLDTREKQGIKDDAGEEGKFLPAKTDKRAYGNKVQIELTGSEVKGGAMDFAPAIDSFLKEHLFADIFGRGILSYQDREFATIAALSSMNGVNSQLRSHISTGMNIGITDAQIRGLISVISVEVGKNEGRNAGDILDIVLKAKENPESTKQSAFDTVFPQGEINPYNKYFTGTTYLTMLSGRDDVFNAPIGSVTFEPGARTNWHKHSGGQILLVTAGEGRYQERGDSLVVIKKGDVVRIAPDVEHWHGASPDSWFAHISLETNIPDNQVTWLEQVTDEQYK